jgi:hypothetical protein
MMEAVILISDGISDAFSLRQIADGVGLHFRMGKVREGWACGSCANGVAFHLESEKGNATADVSKQGYQKPEDCVRNSFSRA